MSLKALQDSRHEKLFALMELANCAAPSGLPDIGSPPDGLSVDALSVWWEQQIAQLDPQLRNYIGGVDSRTSRRYSELKQAVRALRQLAGHRGVLKPRVELAHFQVDLMVNDDGLLFLTSNDLLESIVLSDAQRIRLCDCGKIFWAERKDQPCCGRKCANARRVKKWRENYPDKYKQQRYQRMEEE